MEHIDYRNNLEQILSFTGGRQLLNASEVMRFTGIKDRRTLRGKFPMHDNTISAATLARCLCGGDEK